MIRPSFTLILVTSADGFIARHSGHSPADWACAAEQALFFQTVEAADWGIMGRVTHQVADRPQRRRIVFSASAPVADWRRPTQVWMDPAMLRPADLPGLVADRHRMSNGLILGGTRVHDWFLAHDAIDRVLLTVEPVRFGSGVPVFTGQAEPTPEAILSDRGFEVTETRWLNPAGSRLIHWRRAG